MNPQSYPQPEETQTLRKPIDSKHIHPKAWNAADRLRAMLLKRDPAMAMRNWKWADDSHHRVAWAEQFRLLTTKDGRTWDEVREVVVWLFEGQTPATPQFVVHSPEALRMKWDRIREAMRQQAARAAAPAPSKFADNRPAPEFKRWEVEK